MKTPVIVLCRILCQFSEGLYRTVTTGGITLLTFTPLQGRSAADGRSLMEMYRRAGLNLMRVNAVEAGIQQVWQLLVSGGLKVMPNCENWLREFRRYHRDDKGSGKIVKQGDHLMDATRYLIVSGHRCMQTMPVKPGPTPLTRHYGPRDWMV